MMSGIRPSVSCVVILGALACSRATHSPNDAGDATQPTYARYWLVNTAVLDTPGGRERTRVTTPRLVELLPGGRVRAPNTDPPFEGFLPPDILDRPGKDRGLMLYAETVAELRCHAPTGPMLGRLHPGA